VDRTTGGDPIEWESGIVDISDLSLEELGSLTAGALPASSSAADSPAAGESALARSLRRVAEELTDATEQIAGFNSAL
jgi:FXSXX-COOH protein